MIIAPPLAWMVVRNYYEPIPDHIRKRGGRTALIDVHALRKEYDGLVAVDDVTFSARPGEIFGLLGPNGAGKSTTIGCISGLLAPTGGRVHVQGHDVARSRARRSLGWASCRRKSRFTRTCPPRRTCVSGEAYGLTGARLAERIRTVLETVGLLDRADDKVETFSGGMKRRLNFGCGIVHQPEVLLLDEPTVGVDPQSRACGCWTSCVSKPGRRLRPVHDPLHGRGRDLV